MAASDKFILMGHPCGVQPPRAPSSLPRRNNGQAAGDFGAAGTGVEEHPDATVRQRLYTGDQLTRIIDYDCDIVSSSGACDTAVAREERSTDGLGRLYQRWGPYGDTMPPSGDVITTYAYSDAGHLTLVEDPLGQQTRYTWDSGVLTGESVDGLIVRALT